MVGVDELRERHAGLLARLRTAAERGGHDPARLRIIAVTKTWPVEVARAAVAAGLTALGENRVQEAEPKIAALPEVEWHLVGHLQSNKASRAGRLFRVIHSVDSVELLDRLERIAPDGNGSRLLLQVNITGEESKGGFAPDEVVPLAGRLADASVVGLMTIARMAATAEEARATFGRLRALRDSLEQGAGIGLPELSMGMSDDADAAAGEGATLVRIGTALFGRRP
jgi:PLP dependent protein